MPSDNTPNIPAGADVTMGEIARTMDRMDRRMERVVEDHEQRLRRVERWMYILPPTVITAGAAVVLSIVRATGKGG